MGHSRQVNALYQMFGYMSQTTPARPEQWRPAVCPTCPERSGTSASVPPVDVVNLLTANAGPIVGGLIGSVATILGVLITRGTVRSLSRKERADEYRREMRSAVSSIVREARTFIDAASAFERSMFWINDAVRITPDHNESYLRLSAQPHTDSKLPRSVRHTVPKGAQHRRLSHLDQKYRTR